MIRPPFLQQGLAAKRPTPSWLALVFSVVGTVVAALITTMLFAPVISRLQGPRDAGSITDSDRYALLDGVTLISGVSVIIIILIFVWVSQFEKRPIETLGLRLPAWRKFFFGCLAGLGAIAFMACGLTVFFGASITMSLDDFPVQALLTTLMMMPLAWVLQGISEELMFRGFLLQSIGLHHGLIPAALVSSILFAMFHFDDGASGFAYFAGLTALGFFLCVYATIENSLWGPIGFNVAWNFSQYTIFGFSLADSDRAEMAFYSGPARSAKIVSVETMAADYSIMLFATAVVMIVVLLMYSLQRRVPGV